MGPHVFFRLPPDEKQHVLTLADVLAEKRKTEADAIIGYLLKRAKESGEPAPHLTFLYRSIKALENE